jgi:hypothetical protein
MKVNYTLPGLLPEQMEPAAGTGERAAEPFGAQLQRLRVPDVTDWRDVLRLNTPPGGNTSLGPPPAPSGTESRDGASQRAWWRGMLHKHMSSQSDAPQETVSGMSASGQTSVQRMLGLLQESQRLEDQIFARHFAEGGN